MGGGARAVSAVAAVTPDGTRAACATYAAVTAPVGAVTTRTSGAARRTRAPGTAGATCATVVKRQRVRVLADGRTGATGAAGHSGAARCARSSAAAGPQVVAKWQGLDGHPCSVGAGSCCGAIGVRGRIAARCAECACAAFAACTAVADTPSVATVSARGSQPTVSARAPVAEHAALAAVATSLAWRAVTALAAVAEQQSAVAAILAWRSVEPVADQQPTGTEETQECSATRADDKCGRRGRRDQR